MLFAVAVNDLADEEIDRVNLADGTASSSPGARARQVRHRARKRWIALMAAAVLGWSSVVVVAGGLALAAAYSLPPFRLSSRGALTSALLPLGYVTVPYLVGAFSAGATLHQLHPVLLAGMYLGFMGRLALKDFRDEHGDRLYGKRTTLVRHGRERTCLFSAVFWSAGAVVSLRGLPSRVSTTAAMIAYILVVVAMLADIARDDAGSPRRREHRGDRRGRPRARLHRDHPARHAHERMVGAESEPHRRLRRDRLPRPRSRCPPRLPPPREPRLGDWSQCGQPAPVRRVVNATTSPPLSPAESTAVRMVVTAMVGFGVYGFATGASSTVAYLLSVVAVGLVIRRFRRDPIPAPLATGLAVAAVAHLAGGLVRVGDDVLYNASIGPHVASLHTHVLQYDHFAHAFAVFVGTLTLWTLLALPISSVTNRRSLIVLCTLAGLGIGGINETIEFLATIAHAGAGVGGYTNTGWDLVSNLIGATTAAVVIVRAHDRAPARAVSLALSS